MFNLGDKFSFEKDGVILTDEVRSVRYESGCAAVYRDLNAWQSLLRRLTPRRWRRSLCVQTSQVPKITINDHDDGVDPVGKTIAQLEQIKAAWTTILEDR